MKIWKYKKRMRQCSMCLFTLLVTRLSYRSTPEDGVNSNKHLPIFQTEWRLFPTNQSWTDCIKHQSKTKDLRNPLCERQRQPAAPNCKCVTANRSSCRGRSELPHHSTPPPLLSSSLAAAGAAASHGVSGTPSPTRYGHLG